jgi:hypothetical protein
MKSTDFDHVIDLPRRSHVVYVLFYTLNDQEVERPFYVGETNRFEARMFDYVIATFGSATDFKVGEAVRFLVEVGNARVTVGYDECADRTAGRKLERNYIKRMHSEGFRLINDLKGYDYRTATDADERTRVQEFCKRELLKIS